VAVALMSLFEADDYTTPGKRAKVPKHLRKPKPHKDPPPPTVAVVVDGRWKYSHRSTPGVVHCGSHPSSIHAGRPMVSFCGLVGVPLTLQPGEVVHGCGVCIERGAPASTAVAS
jgi:hypothetical protein